MSADSPSRSWPAGSVLVPAATAEGAGGATRVSAGAGSIVSRAWAGAWRVGARLWTMAGADGAALPGAARAYVGGISLLGAVLLIADAPSSIPDPVLSGGLLMLSLVSSALKISLPLPKTAATMSVSYVADFMSLILLGPEQTMIIAGAGAWAQCTFNQRRGSGGHYRTVFSISALIVTVQTTNLAYVWLGGRPGMLDLRELVNPIVGGAIAYYLSNTILVALASALATRQSPWRFWHDAFLWSAPSYFVGAGVAMGAALLIVRGEVWMAPMAVAPVYLTYRTYKVYLGRIEDERRHVQEISTLHTQAMEALDLARRSEQALATEKERLAITLGSIGEAVITSDAQGRVVLLNHTAERFTGWSREAAVGQPLIEILRLVDRATGAPCESPVARVLRTQAQVERDAHSALVARDGAQRLVEHTGTPIRDNDGAISGVVLVVRDVTDAVRLEEERLKASKLSSLGVLAGGIAHDFNNILTAIAGNVSLAQLEHGSPALHGSLAEAERACVRAKALTQQLLTFSKGGAPVKRTIFLREIIREATGFALRGSNVRCDFQLADDLWAVDADEGQIVQVINNLVINAVQAMPGGGVLTIRAENVAAGAEGASAGRPEVRIAVQDQGTGIPEEHQAKIFDPYFTTKATGSGLGLATCYSIVRNHDGHISVRSAVGEGTTMTITLAAVPDAARAAMAAARCGPRRGRGRILVMDDEGMIRELASRMLNRVGYRADVARDGREAIDMYARAMEEGDPFDAVVMDLTVPGGMGGKDAITALRALDPSVTAIVSSGYADDPVMAEHQRYGFTGVVPKPFTVAELSRLLQQLIH